MNLEASCWGYLNGVSTNRNASTDTGQGKTQIKSGHTSTPRMVFEPTISKCDGNTLPLGLDVIVLLVCNEWAYLRNGYKIKTWNKLIAPKRLSRNVGVCSLSYSANVKAVGRNWDSLTLTMACEIPSRRDIDIGGWYTWSLRYPHK